jgi:FolB domain-containing protein
MDIIRIRRLELDCIVGIRPQEREHRQRVRLDIGLHADVSAAGRTGRISLTADYDQVAHEVAELLSFRHYHLIEMAAEEVSAMLLGAHALVQRVDLRIEKPGALEGRARAASVEVRRTRRDYPKSVQAAPYGQHELLLETREARLELVRVEPRASLFGGPGFPAQSLFWLLSGSLEGERGSVSSELPDGARQSSSEATAALLNPGPDPAYLFRCWKRTQPGH